MSDRHDYYFGEVVTESELDEGFDYLEQADWDMSKDTGTTGIVVPWYDFDTVVPYTPASWLVQEDTVPSWLVRVTTGYGYDKLGRRLAVDPAVTVTVDCSTDYLGVSNAVAAGNERWISLFVKFARDLSDPRTDDGGATVWFLQDEDYTIEVRQGPEELAPAVTKPARDSQAILITDILIDNATPPILNAAIDRWSRPEYPCRVNIVDVATAAFGGLPTWWPFPTPGILDYVLGRNLSEAVWFVLYDIAQVLDAGFLTRHGDTQMEGDLDPDVDCTYDLGATARWRQLRVQAISQVPDLTDSGASEFYANADWDTLISVLGHAFAARLVRKIGGWDATQWTGLDGRTHKQYLENIDDFKKMTDPDVGRYDVFTFGGATVTPNPAPLGLRWPGGFVELDAPPGGTNFLVTGLSYPYRVTDGANHEYEPMIEHGILVEAFPATGAYFAVGAYGPGGAMFVLLYDPIGTYLAVPNGNWWCYYQDGLGNIEEYDTGTPFGTGYYKVSVSFEKDANTSAIWLIWYVNDVVVHAFDVTSAGGTWLANLQGLIWDLAVDCSHIGVGPSNVTVLWDYVKELQFRGGLM